MAKREITMVDSKGRKTTYTVGPKVRNFNQIQVGDLVKVTAVNQLVVFLRKRGSPPENGEATAIALAPKGAKPGVFMADTIQTTAKIEGLDLKHRKATLVFADGETKTIPVRNDVDMTKVGLGDQVVIRHTEALAILVEKP